MRWRMVIEFDAPGDYVNQIPDGILEQLEGRRPVVQEDRACPDPAQAAARARAEWPSDPQTTRERTSLAWARDARP